MDNKPKTRRRKGERKDKRIQVTYTDGYRPDGKPNRISFYGKTRAEAIRKRDEYKARGGKPFSGDEITVSEWIEQYKSLYSHFHERGALIQLPGFSHENRHPISHFIET